MKEVALWILCNLELQLEACHTHNNKNEKTTPSMIVLYIFQLNMETHSGSHKWINANKPINPRMRGLLCI